MILHAKGNYRQLNSMNVDVGADAVGVKGHLKIFNFKDLNDGS